MKEDIFEVADWLYDNDVNEWHLFSDNELQQLWQACKITGQSPYGRAYDDEVYNELNKRNLI